MSNVNLATALGLIEESDPHIDSVVLLVDFEGRNNNTGLSEFNGRNSTISNSPYISTARSRFGRSSGQFDGNEAWWFAHATDLNLATGDWTIEYSFLADSLSANRTILSKDGRFGTSYSSYGAYIDSAGRHRFQIGTGNGVSSSQSFNSGGAALATGAWHDGAAVKSGSNLLLFTNGVLESTTAITASFVDGGQALWIGNYQSNATAGDSWVGGLDAIRITKGVARYSASYTPRTKAFPRR